MSTNEVSKLIDAATSNFEAEVAAILARHSRLIGHLTKAVDEVGLDAIVDEIHTVGDQVAGKIGSDVANQLEFGQEQEEAHSLAEEWVSSHVANSGAEAFVMAAIWANGTEKAAENINVAIAEANRLKLYCITP